MNSGIFVTGTGTGVGKTVLACGIARFLSERKRRVGVMKPVATGDREDAKALLKASGFQAGLDIVNPQFFKAPLAPAVAAALESRTVDLEKIYQSFWAIAKASDVVVVEGIGGVKVPLGDSTYVIDLIGALRLPALVVASAGLGTLNHTLLTLEALEREQIPIVGVILNGSTEKSLAEKTNLEALHEHTSHPCFGVLKQSKSYAKDPSATARALAQWPAFEKAILRYCPAPK
jgi:dethiobiotin synthetase